MKVTELDNGLRELTNIIARAGSAAWAARKRVERAPACLEQLRKVRAELRESTERTTRLISVLEKDSP